MFMTAGKPATRPLVAINQYGQAFILKTQHPRKELLGLYGRRGCSKMYRDDSSLPGGARHVGYVIGTNWIEIFELVRWQSPQEKDKHEHQSKADETIIGTAGGGGAA